MQQTIGFPWYFWLLGGQPASEAAADPGPRDRSSTGRKREVSLAEALSAVRDADLLLWRRSGVVARIGRGEHSHAALAAWWDGELFALEVTPCYGGRAVSLAAMVRRWPGCIDLFQADPDGRFPEFDRAAAVQAMKQLMGQPYGYLTLVRIILRRLPLVRLIVPAVTTDAERLGPPAVCSQAVAWATRAGGVDPVPFLADRFTEPADLARSLFYRYRLTFVP
jgi:hypothetical protein